MSVNDQSEQMWEKVTTDYFKILERLTKIMKA